MMFSTLPVVAQEELTNLATLFGQPLVHAAKLASAQPFDPLSSHDRHGEVCMVVRRPNGRLLTSKKTFYPPDAYRLLTGGINYDEPVLDALLRETHEETGLEVVVRRFLVAVSYQFSDQLPSFYTFAFLLDEVGGTLQSLDEDEQVEYFREIDPQDLPARAEFLEGLNASYSEELRGNWADWGPFRAVIHRLAWKALRPE